MSLQAMQAVWNCRQLSDERLRLCLLAMADRSTSNRDGPFYTFPGHKDIAQRCVRSERTVRRWIEMLERLGYLQTIRRQDGVGYLILLSTDGERLPISDRPTCDRSDRPFDTDASISDRPTGDRSDRPSVVSDRPSVVSDRPFFDGIKGIEHTENITENREERSTFPQNNGAQKPQPDRMSADRWRQLCDRIAAQIDARTGERIITPYMARELRRARLELYEESNDALVILPTDSVDAADLYHTRFMEHILLHLPDVTRHRGWRVVIWTESELANAEQEIHA